MRPAPKLVQYRIWNKSLPSRMSYERLVTSKVNSEMSRRWGINFMGLPGISCWGAFQMFNSNFIGLEGREMWEVWKVASFDIYLLGKKAQIRSMEGILWHLATVDLSERHLLCPCFVKHRWSEFSSFPTRKSYILRKRPPPTLPPILVVQWKVCPDNLSFLSWEKRLSAKSEEKCQNLKVLAICWSGSVLHVKISALTAWCSRC